MTEKLDMTYGIFARAKVALTSDMEVFARAGRNGWRGTASTPTTSVSINVYDWIYSGGVNYNVNTSTYLTGSWGSLYNKNSTKVDGWSLGVGFRF